MNARQGRVKKLAPRQRQILLMRLRDRMSCREIAMRLNLEYPTVRNIITQVYKKLDATNIVEAMHNAWQTGEIELSDIFEINQPRLCESCIGKGHFDVQVASGVALRAAPLAEFSL